MGAIESLHRKYRPGLAVAGLVLAILCVGCGASASVPSVAPPTPSPTPAGGPHEFTVVGLPRPVTMELPPGWAAEGPVVTRATEEDATLMSVTVWVVKGVYRDPCHWSAGAQRTGRRAEALAAALAAQPGRHARVSNVTIGDHSALRVTMEVPDDADFAACDEGEFRTWAPVGSREARSHEGPGELDEIYVIQVGRRRAVVDASYFADADSDELAELHRIIASVAFGSR